MSIASEEASAKYPIFVAPQGNAGRDWIPICDEENALTLSKRSGYVAGRTSDVTDTEVNAAISEWDWHGYYSVGRQIVCMCGAMFTDRRGYRVHLVRAMLEEARKAVM